MPLFQRRARDEARAQTPAPLVTTFSDQARTKIALAMFDFGTGLYDPPNPYGREVSQAHLTQAMHSILAREWGTDPGNTLTDMLGRAGDGEVPDVIESWFVAVGGLAQEVEDARGYVAGGHGTFAREIREARSRLFIATVNDVMDDHGIASQIHDQRIVPRSSMAMHATIVEPVLALTSGERRFRDVESAYAKALQELRIGGDPADAITDAGAALQAMLTVVGAKGNALGGLLTDARKRGLLGPYDSKLTEGIFAIGEWVSADRGTKGDAHGGTATRDDAWLAVRVAGALILRLGAGGKR